MRENDLLIRVRTHLNNDVGRLRQVADETGIPYDTVLRIKNAEGDPGYSKVQTLATHYGLTGRAERRHDNRRASPGRRSTNGTA